MELDMLPHSQESEVNSFALSEALHLSFRSISGGMVGTPQQAFRMARGLLKNTSNIKVTFRHLCSAITAAQHIGVKRDEALESARKFYDGEFRTALTLIRNIGNRLDKPSHLTKLTSEINFIRSKEFERKSRNDILEVMEKLRNKLAKKLEKPIRTRRTATAPSSSIAL
jgi:hypothetical protein